MVESNISLVSERVNHNKFGVFGPEDIAYWNSLNKFQKARLAKKCLKATERLNFEIFLKPLIQAVRDWLGVLG